MAESAAATPSAPVANTPAAGGQGQGSGAGDTNSQTPQSQSTNQNQNQTNNNASSATTANNNNNNNSNSNNNNENQPPDQRPNRGLPYYEKLRRDLRDTIQKKRLMDKTMVRAKRRAFLPKS